MKVGRLIEILKRFPADYNARVYEGEVCGLIVEDKKYGDHGAVIYAHESENDDSPDFCRGCEPEK